MTSPSSVTPTPEAGARKERPILMSGPMIRAILDGSKMQTRRIIKPAPVNVVPFIGADDKPTHEFGLCLEYERVISKHVRCPYGQPGDHLWCRESWALLLDPGATETFESVIPDRRPTARNRVVGHVPTPIYRADGERPDVRSGDVHGGPMRWRPFIHMPRWASRITLEVESVRVERLQDISEEDARAEGATFVGHGKTGIPLSLDGGKTWGEFPSQNAGWSMEHPRPSGHCLGSARMAFANLWNRINGPGSWDASPWVWVVAFRKVRP